MAGSTTDRKFSKPKLRQSIAHVPSRSTALKDNVTTDIAALHAQHNVTQASKKRSRGKSLGPGGLEALTESNGNTTKTAEAFQIKSILKPTVPLTPPKSIPTFDELRKRSTGKGKGRSPAKHGAEELLIDFSTPGPNRQEGGEISMTGAENVADPFSPIASRTPRKSVAANADTLERAQEEELKRQAEKQAILERRAARRKSLANRRVSFAPEATLHTWSVMELAEDSTTSSASNSTRRQSSMTAQQSPEKPLLSPEKSTSLSTPVEQIEDPMSQSSPAHQRDLHQQKHRRASDASQPMLDESQDEMFSSSPSGDVTTNSSPMRVEEGIESSDESDTDGDTAMSMDDATAHTMNSQDSESSTHSSLEERLRQAVTQAGTAGIEYDEDEDEEEDMSMEMATGTVTHAFQPYTRKQSSNSERSAVYDQENINPLMAAHQRENPGTEMDDESQVQSEDMSMDVTMEVTRAVGGIISRQSPGKKSLKSPKNRGRRSSIHPRRSSEGESAYDETMEFTVMQGGILGEEDESSPQKTQTLASDEMTMEFTNVVGGVLSNAGRRQSVLSDQLEDNETMDMTTAFGGILEPIEEHTEPQTDADEEKTVAMDMTKAVGSILNQHSPATKRVTRQSAGNASTPPRAQASEQTTPKTTPKSQLHLASVASETGSPSLVLKPQLSGRAQRSATKASTTPQRPPHSSRSTKSPSRPQAGTPSHQITPLPSRAPSPNKTPLSANVTQRGASPKKLFKAEIKARASPASAKREVNLKANTLFSRDAETGQQTPSVILRATKTQLNRRRSSGIGIDRDGIGSPRVSEILDRRASIGEASAEFKLGSTEPARLRFEDPELLEREIEVERAEEQRRESGRFIMEQEANGPEEETATLQLKEMIETMSPKKPKPGKPKGRKSLAPGGAKGLLGKRPAELDLDDEDEAESTPKRLKAVSREGSPIKKVHLPKPPSKDETTGRLSLKLQKSLQEMAGTGKMTPTIEILSPTKTTVPASPAAAGRFKDIATSHEDRPTSFEDKLDNVVGAIDITTAQMEDGSDQAEQEKISLQEFLNMTNIHFIELSTTKRRHTMAQSMPGVESAEGLQIPSMQMNFVAAATTLPLLELYQHATRELKSYISTGRKIIRSIEAETLAEQPPLFREYLDARPDVKVVMDNQFRNGKANARLQSKEGWYQWRGQLVEGLKTGLEGIKQGMTADLELLRQQQEHLATVVPCLLQEQSELQDQANSLRQSLEELDSADHEALVSCRDQLRRADEHHLQKSAHLEDLQQQMREKDEALVSAADYRAELQDQIAESERVREENRVFPVADVLAVKAKVEALQKQTAWCLLTAEEEVDEPNELGPAFVMRYKGELQLFFYPQAFQCKLADSGRRRSGRKSTSVSGPSAPISLTYAPEQEDSEAGLSELPTEKRFFLQMIRSQLHAFAMMPKGAITAKTLLSTVSKGWDLACRVSEEMRLLNLLGITTASILGDEKLGVKIVLLLPTQGRVDIQFAVTVTILNDGEVVGSSNVTATAVYGLAMELLAGKNRKVQNALSKEVETRTLGEGAWVNAVHGFKAWISSQEKTRTKEDKKKQPSTTDEVVQTPAPAPVAAAEPATVAPIIAAPAPVAPKRSPLAPKRTNLVQKKALPIAKQRLEKFNLSQSQQSSQHGLGLDKENFNPSLSVSSKGGQAVPVPVPVPDDGNNDREKDFPSRPAIPPDMQEVMMHTPIKRVGALRRSPV
ncbi:hypothetical protein LTR96_010715 [Exophiala xenobiotica]|nr:hypothetical protein LTR92_005086 [Exophiala xenobiotica]KAK5263997.1 hypothetical protein LTR96_010715 [Exophiala xenobiotica]KAK5340914.1 hypothetical protein LTR98_001706 [Exophiala xenobiotica]KAK5551438.1 hypothetical protein LTR46_010639 [Exophiala xenobiotica]